MDDLVDRAAIYFQSLQDRICAALERIEADSAGAARAGARFREDQWERPGGGGGRSRVIEGGALFEKAGVNLSYVHGGDLPDEIAVATPGARGERSFRATGISLVLHPASPMVPTVHANFRCLSKGDATWFGGGADLTPYYPHLDDIVHFHRTWKTVCDAHDPAFYPQFKKSCDEYFTLAHRGEARGVGGIFFDYLQGDLEHTFAFVRDAGDAFLASYLPIADRRRREAFGERERAFQLHRRGRYVEFNLLFDRGTVFGLKTGGRIESILMSLPPLASWSYGFTAEPGSREAELERYLRPTDWLAGGAGAGGHNR